MAKPYRIISFSSDPFDQWRLSEVKGVITVKDRRPAFQFDTKEQFERYLQLNSFRRRIGV